MKILITTDTYDPAINGVVTSIKTLAHQLTLRGHDVRILAPAAHDGYVRGVYGFKSVAAGMVYPDARLAVTNLVPNRLIDQIIDWCPDVVHSQTEFTSYLSARKIARACHAPLVCTVHTYYEDYTQYFCPNKAVGKAAVGKFMRFVLDHAAAAVVPTMKIAHVLEGYQVHTPVFCIPTGIDQAPFERITADKRRELRESLGISDKDCVFVTVGRMAQEKNHQMLLDGFARAWERAHEEGASFDAKLLLVGDGPYVGELREYAQGLACADRIVFAGRVPREKVAAYYRAGDVFVNASNSETQGLTYLEALCAGLPLLVKNDECLNGVLKPQVNGVAYDTVEELGALMLQFECDRAHVMALHKGAQASAHEHSAEAFGREAESLYEYVLEGALVRRRFAFAWR